MEDLLEISKSMNSCLKVLSIILTKLDALSNACVAYMYVEDLEEDNDGYIPDQNSPEDFGGRIFLDDE